MALTNCEKFGYGAGHAFNDLCATLWFTYSLLYYKVIAGLSGSMAGAIMLIGQVADAVANPVIGVVTDRTSVFEKWGKKKSWHLLGTLGVFVSVPFMYSPSVLGRDASQWANFTYYSFFVVIFQFAWSVVQVTHLAIVTNLSSDHIERTQLFSIRNSFTFLASIFTYAVSWGVLCQDHSDNTLTAEDSIKFMLIVLIICILGAFMSVIYYLTIDEKKHLDNQESIHLTEKERRPVKEVLSRMIFYQATVIYVCSRVFCNVSQSFLNLYLNDELRVKKECTATIPLLSNVVSFLTSCASTKVNQTLGRRHTFVLGCAVGLTACSWIWLDGDEGHMKSYGVYVVGVILGLTYPLLLITSLSITADTIGKDVGNSALVYGLMSFFEKIVNGLVIFFIECLAPGKGESQQVSWFYRYSIVYSTSLAMLMGLIFIFTIPTDYKDN